MPLFEEAVRKIKNVRVINNKLKKIGEIVIGGVEYFVEDEWVKNFAPGNKRRMKNAKKETAKAKKVLNKFGKLDILLCHQPPYGILDKVNFSGAPKKPIRHPVIANALDTPFTVIVLSYMSSNSAILAWPLPKLICS